MIKEAVSERSVLKEAVKNIRKHSPIELQASYREIDSFETNVNSTKIRFALLRKKALEEARERNARKQVESVANRFERAVRIVESANKIDLDYSRPDIGIIEMSPEEGVSIRINRFPSRKKEGEFLVWVNGMKTEGKNADIAIATYEPTVSATLFEYNRIKEIRTREVLQF